MFSKVIVYNVGLEVKILFANLNWRFCFSS